MRLSVKGKVITYHPLGHGFVISSFSSRVCLLFTFTNQSYDLGKYILVDYFCLFFFSLNEVKATPTFSLGSLKYLLR